MSRRHPRPRPRIRRSTGRALHRPPPGSGSGRTPAQGAAEPRPVEPGTAPTGTVQPQDVDQVPVATDHGSPTATEGAAASSAEELQAGRSTAGAPLSGSSSSAEVQGPGAAPAASSPPSAEPSRSDSGSVVPPPPSSTAAPLRQPVPDPITPAPTPTSAPTPEPLPTAAPVPDPAAPAPDPPTTALDPEPAEPDSAQHRTADDDGHPGARPEPTSTPWVTEPASAWALLNCVCAEVRRASRWQPGQAPP